MLIGFIVFLECLAFLTAEQLNSSSTVVPEVDEVPEPKAQKVELTWVGFGDREEGDEMVVWDKRMFNSSRELTSCFSFNYQNFRFTFANLTTTDVSKFNKVNYFIMI